MSRRKKRIALATLLNMKMFPMCCSTVTGKEERSQRWGRVSFFSLIPCPHLFPLFLHSTKFAGSLHTPSAQPPLTGAPVLHHHDGAEEHEDLHLPLHRREVL